MEADETKEKMDCVVLDAEKKFETETDGIKVERTPNETKKRKREAKDTGEKADGPDGFEKPDLPKTEGGAPTLKKFRDSPPDDSEEIKKICEAFKGGLEKFVEDLVSDNNEIIKIDEKTKEKAKVWLEKSRSVNIDYFTTQFSGVLPKLYHKLGAHHKIVDSVLEGIGIVKEQLGKSVEKAEEFYVEMVLDIRCLCDMVSKMQK